ncbi:hypothetical protein ER308_17875 [Egibacter rhizosphaerae]|uniref:Uncharacterized protein n=1 Tax=Egibacter rhizosphaerae TaxID=1670831 RepID=A0A411YIY0_9ACTN|nr:hypothetical protein [Egibacter rhizosphaerae]QBI21254.1 hypothetical protein ER308_17875 [Egibacter rhizosphaerae]
MDVGPLRRMIGALGLIGLAPTAWLLITGGISPPTAAIRGLATLVAVVLVGRLVGAVVRGLAGRVEANGHTTTAPARGPSAQDGRPADPSRRAGRAARRSRGDREGAGSTEEGSAARGGDADAETAVSGRGR